MDDLRFDSLARGLGRRWNRRQAIGIAAAGVAAVAVARPDLARAQTTCSLTCQGDIGTDTDQGICTATVLFETPTMDGDCGKVSVDCDADSGDSFPIGQTVVTCQTSDQSANCAFSIFVSDPEIPSITCPPDQIVTTTVPVGVTLSDPTIVATCSDSDFHSFCDIDSGEVFQLGDTLVTCQVKLDMDNPPTCTYTVHLVPPDPTATDTVEATETEAPATIQPSPSETPATLAPATYAPNPTPTATVPVTSLPNTGSGGEGGSGRTLLPIAIVGGGAALLTRLGLRSRKADGESALD